MAGKKALHAQQQEHDSKTRYTSREHLDCGSDSLNFEDTSLDEFHLYYPVLKDFPGAIDLGNSGTPVHAALFPRNTNTGFQLGWNYLDPYLFSSRKEQRYYKLRRPLTSLNYAQGANELLKLEAFHSQNIRPNWNMGIDYRRLKEDGFYLRQKTSLYNVRLFNWFHSRDYRYHLLASAVFDRNLNEESGGLLSRASFDTLSGPSRVAGVKYMTSAQQWAMNGVRSNAFSVTQYFRVGKNIYFPAGETDSLGRALPDTIATLVPQAQFFLHTEYNAYQNIFSVNTLEGLGLTRLYRDIYATYDSLFHRSARASFGFQSGQYRVLSGDSMQVERRKWHYNISLGYQLEQVFWKEDRAVYHNFSLEARAGTNPFDPLRKLHFDVRYYQGLSGYNAGDYQLKSVLSRQEKKIKMGVSLLSKLYAPDFIQYYYAGNEHFWFNRGFTKQSRNELGLFISRFSAGRQQAGLELDFIRLGNYIYYDVSASPVQGASPLSFLRFSFSSHLKKGVFNLKSRVAFQAGDTRHELRLPSLLMYHSLYAQRMLFRNALNASLGVDFYYSSSYFAPVYEASLRIFRLQDDFVLGNYPYFNAFFTGQIKTVTFFFLFQHLNMGLSGKNWYASPYYPMQPRSLRLGLRWKLYD